MLFKWHHAASSSQRCNFHRISIKLVFWFRQKPDSKGPRRVRLLSRVCSWACSCQPPHWSLHRVLWRIQPSQFSFLTAQSHYILSGGTGTNLFSCHQPPGPPPAPRRWCEGYAVGRGLREISAGVTNIMPPRHFIYCCRPTVQSSYFMVYGSPITILWQPPTDKRQLGSIFCDGGEVDTTRAL